MKFTDEHDQFRSAIRDLVEREINPHCDTWEADGIFPAHDLFAKLGRVGVLGVEEQGAVGSGGVEDPVLVEA